MTNVLITGCSSGIGLLTALHCARRGDPQEVAALIHETLHAPAPALRHVAGDDARMIATAHRQMDFEAYERAMRQALDWSD